MAEGRRHVILIGPMGVGKTTVGEHLADRLGRPFLDSDEVMEDRLGEWSSEIAAREGVEHLHAVELEVFLAMISSPEPSVIASAASVVDSEAGRGALEANLTVWLSASDRVLAQRQQHGHHRRAVDAGERRALHSRRAPLLEAAATLRLDTDQRSIDALVDEVADRVRQIEEPSL